MQSLKKNIELHGEILLYFRVHEDMTWTLKFPESNSLQI